MSNALKVINPPQKTFTTSTDIQLPIPQSKTRTSLQKQTLQQPIHQKSQQTNSITTSSSTTNQKKNKGRVQMPKLPK